MLATASRNSEGHSLLYRKRYYLNSLTAEQILGKDHDQKLGQKVEKEVLFNPWSSATLIWSDRPKGAENSTLCGALIFLYHLSIS